MNPQKTADLTAFAHPEACHDQAARLAASGDTATAAACYLTGIRQFPDNAALRVNVSNMLKTLGRVAEAREHLERAVQIDPALAGAWYNLGILLHQTQWFDEAVTAFEHALRLLQRTDDALLGQVIISCGLSLQSAGHYLEARRFLDQIAQQHPRHAADCLRNALFTWVEDATAGAAQKLAAHQSWAARFADPLMPHHLRHGNVRDPERALRIGYVSGDLRAHAVSYFFESLLEHHDRGAFAIFCYDNTANADATSAVLQRWPATWRNVASLDDDALAELIRADGIDILIDLSGHTARNRLDAMARKPAPLQATWLGYPLSTGMRALDYRISDTTVDPPGLSEHWYSEKLLRLPASAWCFRAPHSAPEVAPLPMLAAGHLTLGSFNHIGKINEAVLDTWAEILHALPAAQLLVARVPQGRCRESFVAQWQRRGIGEQRLQLHGYVNRERFLALHHQVDIALDPFPCPGGTTSCESLWMGLPVLSLDGRAGVARAGTSILNAAGLSDWVARDRAQYLSIALAKAADPQALARLRASMRERLIASSLMDGARFAREFETALRAAWRRWCDQP